VLRQVRSKKVVLISNDGHVVILKMTYQAYFLYIRHSSIFIID
jgi:hypothetical protein